MKEILAKGVKVELWYDDELCVYVMVVSDCLFNEHRYESAYYEQLVEDVLNDERLDHAKRVYDEG